MQAIGSQADGNAKVRNLKTDCILSGDALSCSFVVKHKETKMPVTRDWIDETCDIRGINALCADGFDEAILGMLGDVVAYSTKKILDILMEQGLSYEDAQEHFDFNIAGSMGEGYPVYIDDLEH